MKRVCRVCNHPKSDEINKRLLGNATQAQISREYDIDVQVIARHVKNGHMTQSLAEVSKDLTINVSESLLERVEALRKQTKELYELESTKPVDEVDIKALTGLLREMREQLKFIAEVAIKIAEIDAQKKQEQIIVHLVWD